MSRGLRLSAAETLQRACDRRPGGAETHPDVAVETCLERNMVDRTLGRLGEDAELVVVGTRTASIVTEQSTGIGAVVPERAAER